MFKHSCCNAEAMFTSLLSFLCLKRHSFDVLVLKKCVLAYHWSKRRSLSCKTVNCLWKREYNCHSCVEARLQQLHWHFPVSLLGKGWGSTLLCLACWPACCQGHCARTLTVFAHCTANAAFALALRQRSLLAWLIGEPPCALYASSYRTITDPRYLVTWWHWLRSKTTAVIGALKKKRTNRLLQCFRL